MSPSNPTLLVKGPVTPIQGERVLTDDALQFVATLEEKFGPVRQKLLAARVERQRSLDAGKLPDFLAETAKIRAGDWQVGATPHDLLDRRVEITGPAEAKMMINALNSGAKAFMCDLEDSFSPTWGNVVDGQIHLQDAVRRTLKFRAENGKDYALNKELATLIVRPRGWHLPERHVALTTAPNAPISGSLFDFGLYFFHNAKAAKERGTGAYFYLPKMESHVEARLWNDVFNFSQDALDLPRGTIKCTVLIETILAAYEMDEILYELRDHIVALNAGRWDYIFSIIKKFSLDATRILPDRAQVTMAVPFMRAYAELLVKTCHHRGAHAMGGMAAFIPSRKDAEVNRVAIQRVTEDKDREATAGFDGTWVAHPDLVPVAMKSFDAKLGSAPNQKNVRREDVRVTAADLIDVKIAGGKITETGVANNINVALQYMDQWLKGVGAVAIHNLMEDAATAEIARAQLWQWVRNGAKLDDGRTMSAALYKELKAREMKSLADEGRYAKVAALLDDLILADRFKEFFTLPAYEALAN